MQYSKPHTRMKKRLVLAVAVGLLLSAAGCTGPRARLGYIPTATFGVPFPDPEDIGSHSFNYSPFESGGIVYTCRAGHLDIDHIRVEQMRKLLTDRVEQFSFSLAGETSTHWITLTYPDDWDSRPDKAAVIEEIAYTAGPYFVYTATVWHEILTWYGVHFMGIEPEFNSAFSWEDLYSNLLGIHLSLEAQRDPEHGYNKAMTLALERALQRLEVQSGKTAKAASDSVRGQWDTGNLVPDMKMRNFDIGLDGSVTPVLIPDVAACPSPEPAPLEVPTLDVLKQFGLTVTYQIKPNVFEQGAIYRDAGEKQIFPEKHFPILLEAMKQQAAEKGYRYTE